MACAPDPSKKKGLAKTNSLWHCGRCQFAWSQDFSEEDAERYHSTLHPECPSLSDTATGLESDAVIASNLSSYENRFKKNGNSREQYDHDFEHEIRLIRGLSCSVCFERWRNVATTTCRHLACCDACLQRTARNCTICRGFIRERFSVKFHSAKLLDEIRIPKASAMRSNSFNDIGILELVGKFRQMGFEESHIRKAIQQNMPRTSGPTSQSLPPEEVVLDSLLDPSQSADDDQSEELNLSSANADEMESILTNPQIDIRVKRKISEYLRIASKCLMCKERPPDICLLPCCHLAVCRICSQDTEKKTRNCPDCGELIKNQYKVHM